MIKVYLKVHTSAILMSRKNKLCKFKNLLLYKRLLVIKLIMNKPKMRDNINNLKLNTHWIRHWKMIMMTICGAVKGASYPSFCCQRSMLEVPICIQIHFQLKCFNKTTVEESWKFMKFWEPYTGHFENQKKDWDIFN